MKNRLGVLRVWEVLVCGVLGASACGSPTINVVEPFAVINWSPHDGATCVDSTQTTLRFSVCMSRAIDEGSLAASMGLHRLDSDGAPAEGVTATATLSQADPACAQLEAFSLDTDSGYAIVLEPTFKAKDGSTLGHKLFSTLFTSDSGCP